MDVKKIFTWIFIFIMLLARPALPNASAAETEIRQTPLLVEVPWVSHSTLSLSDCIAYASQNDPSVLAAGDKTDQARNEWAARKLSYFPKAVVQADAGMDQKGEAVVFSSAGIDVPIFWGNLNAKKKLAQNIYTKSQIEQKIALNQAVLEVSTAFYELLHDQHVSRLLEDSVQQLEEQSRVIRSLVDAGRALRSDKLKIEAQLAEAQSSLIAGQLKQRESSNHLAALLNRKSLSGVILKEEAYIPPALLFDEVTAIAEAESPEYQKLDLDRLSAGLEEQQEKWNFVQGVNLSSRYQRSDASYVAKDDHNQWVTGLRGGLDVWDWGEKKHERYAAKAGARARLREIEQEKRELDRKIRNLYDQLHMSDFQVQAALRSVISMEASYQAEVVRMQNGLVKLQDYLLSRDYLAKARLEYEDALLLREEAKVQLQALLGVWDLGKYENRGLNLSDKDFLLLLMSRAFEYFRREYNPDTGFFLDADGGGSSSMAANGFGLAALVIGVERGWMTREDAQARAVRLLKTLVWLQENNFTYHGLFFHYVDPETGARAGQSEISSIDTALLVAGAAAAAEYFGGDVAEKYKQLAGNIDWASFTGKEGKHKDQFYLSWTPEREFTEWYWDAYTDETLMIVLLALGSPSSKIPAEAYNNFRRERQQYGDAQFYPSFTGSLYTYQYAQLFYDFRTWRDPWKISWFENTRQAVEAQIRDVSRTFPGSRNAREGYWGVSAADTPEGEYDMMLGIKPNLWDLDTDRGVRVPSAVAGSVEFAPAETILSLRKMYENLPQLWGRYGFTSSFDLDKNWFSSKYYSLDMGLELIALDNYLHGTVRKYFMKNTDVLKGLARARFVRLEEAGLSAPPAAAGN